MKEIRRTRLVIEIKRKDSILIEFGNQEVEILLCDTNPSNKAKLCFNAPETVQIARIPGGNSAD